MTSQTNTTGGGLPPSPSVASDQRLRTDTGADTGADTAAEAADQQSTVPQQSTKTDSGAASGSKIGRATEGMYPTQLHNRAAVPPIVDLPPASSATSDHQPSTNGSSAGNAAAPLPVAAPQEVASSGLSPNESLDDSWVRLQAAIRERVQTEQFETWFRRTALTHIDESSVQIAVQNGFTRDWLNTYYRDVLEQAVARVFGISRRVDFTVDPELMVARRPQQIEAAPTSTPTRAAAPAAYQQQASAPKHALLEASDTQLNSGYQFENFVVGPCNRFAHAASVGVSENPGQAYNPYFLHGSVGLGKTHLLQSLCHTILDKDPTQKILYLSCETFVNHFISALENGDLQKFRTKYRNVDVLVVDDIHILANKERTQEEFFHTFNTLYNANKQIVLSSDSPPKDIPTLQGRLVSRFKWGLVTEIEPPCFET
ncbi:MAG: chromosomal replication initiator protein, partial [Planctomycetota bacterium]